MKTRHLYSVTIVHQDGTEIQQAEVEPALRALLGTVPNYEEGEWEWLVELPAAQAQRLERDRHLELRGDGFVLWAEMP